MLTHWLFYSSASSEHVLTSLYSTYSDRLYSEYHSRYKNNEYEEKVCDSAYILSHIFYYMSYNKVFYSMLYVHLIHFRTRYKIYSFFHLKKV